MPALDGDPRVQVVMLGGINDAAVVIHIGLTEVGVRVDLNGCHGAGGRVVGKGPKEIHSQPNQLGSPGEGVLGTRSDMKNVTTARVAGPDLDRERRLSDRPGGAEAVFEREAAVGRNLLAVDIDFDVAHLNVIRDLGCNTYECSRFDTFQTRTVFDFDRRCGIERVAAEIADR